MLDKLYTKWEMVFFKKEFRQIYEHDKFSDDIYYFKK